MRLGLVASVRDEAAYVIEWVAHHRALGFDPVMVFQNDSADGTAELLAALDARGVIVWRDNSEGRDYRRGRLAGLPPVLRALERARRSQAMQACDYVLVCDVDEFLVPCRDPSLAALLERLDFPHAVSFAWRVFGDNGADGFDPRPVANRFPCAARTDDPGSSRPFWQVKTLFRPGDTRQWKQHRPRFGDGPLRWVSADGRNVTDILRAGHILDRPALDHAAMHHYHCKSRAEFHLKILRGYGCMSPGQRVRPGLGTHDAMNANDIACPMPEALRDARTAEMARIRALPGVAAAEADAMARFRTRLDRADRAVRANPGRWGAAFISDTDALRREAAAILDGTA